MSHNRKRAWGLAVCVLAAVLAAPIAVHAGTEAAPQEPTFNAGGKDLLPIEPARSAMSVPQAVILGIVEGVTEYLPISSTGHLTVVQSLLGLWATPEEKSASDAYAICIQAGAIIAVLLIYWRRIKGMAAGIAGRDKDGLRLFGTLILAFIPAAIIGFFLEARIKHYLYGIWPVAAAWLVGGVFIIAVLARRGTREGRPLEGLTWQSALLIGCAQVIALWPGVSRSLATIAAGLFVGLTLSAAVEFSFLLGLLTLGAATLYEGIKLGPRIVQTFGWVSPVVGLAVAAAAAFVAVRWMVEYLRTRSLAVFGWYRIAVAVLAAVLVVAGVLTT